MCVFLPKLQSYMLVHSCIHAPIDCQVEYMQAIKVQQTESMIKQQELMAKMVDTARDYGAPQKLVHELEMISNPDEWGITTDGIDDQVQVGPGCVEWVGRGCACDCRLCAKFAASLV